jgi:peptidoglycan/xylan/chitin deacetylase (PgdA/CDA1 family)
MLKFCLTVDTENFISFRQGNPEWNKWGWFKFRINNLLKNFRYNKNGFFVFYEEIKRQKFPCTFMLVGKLFKPIDRLDFVEWGYHTYNHLPLNLISDESVEKEVSNTYRMNSITCPMWRVEDVGNPARIFEILKKEGYKNTVYHGFCDKEKTLYTKSVRNPEKRFGIKCVYVSNYLEGNFGNGKIEEVKNDILNNLDRDGVYLLTSHDFTHRNVKNLREIIRFVRKLEGEGKIEIVTLDDA